MSHSDEAGHLTDASTAHPTSGQALGAPKKSSLLKSSMVMASGTLISRLLGFLRTAMLLAAVGAVGGGVSATFQVANTLPNTVYNLLAAGVFDAVLVPQIVRGLKRRSGDVYVNRLLTLAGSILFGVTVVAMVCTPLLVMVLASGFDGPARNLTILFCLLCLPQIFFYGLYNLLGELLNARGLFGPYMWAPVVNNIIAIAGLGLFLAIWGTHGTIFEIENFSNAQFWLLGGSASAGVICQALILLIPIKRAGLHVRLDFHFKGTSFGSASRVAGWTFATLGVSQIGIISSTNLATQADGFAQTTGQPIAGYVAFTTTFMIFMLPQSLISVSLATAIFTRLANAAADHDHRAVADNYHMGVRLITMLSLLSAAIFMVGSVPVMQLVIPSASAQTVQSYAWVLVAYMPGVASTGMVLMSQRVFFAYEDAKPVFLMGIVPTLIQIIVGWSLFFTVDAKWWVVGAAAAETTCRITQGFLAVLMVSARNRFVNPGRLIAGYVTYFIAGAVVLALTWPLLGLVGTYTNFDSGAARFVVAAIKLLAVAVLASAIFIGVLRVVAPRESAWVFGYVAQRLHLPAKLFGLPGESHTTVAGSAVAGAAGIFAQARGFVRGKSAHKLAVRHNEDPNRLTRGVSMDQRDNKQDKDQVEQTSPWSAPPVAGGHLDHQADAPADTSADHADGEQLTSATEREDSAQASQLGWNMIARSWSASDPTHTGEFPIITDDVVQRMLHDIDQAGHQHQDLHADTTRDPSEFGHTAPPAMQEHSAEGVLEEIDTPDAASVQGAPAGGEAGRAPAVQTAAVAPTQAETLTPNAEATAFETDSQPVDVAETSDVDDATGQADSDNTVTDTVKEEPLDQPLDQSEQGFTEESEEHVLVPPAPPLPVSPPLSTTPLTSPFGSFTTNGQAGSNAGSNHFDWPQPTTEVDQPVQEHPSGRIDPTKPALIFAAILVVAGAIWGVTTALKPVTGIDQLTGAVSSEQSGQSGQSGVGQSGTSGTQAAVPLELLTPKVFSWNNDDGDHPELAVNMVDGKADTQWYSRWYDLNQFSDDDTITLLFRLKQPAPLSEITLNLPDGVQGGEVVVRNVTDPNQPRQGTTLATSSLSKTTNIKLDQPATVNAFSLSFKTLPTDSEGKFRVFISEVSVK